MTTDDLVKHFGSPGAAQKAIPVSRALWWRWRVMGIPEGPQSKLQIKYEGSLLAGEKLPAKKKKAKK